MNRNGKGAIFIIIIPIIFAILAFLYDNILMITTSKAYREVTDLIINDVLSNSYTNKEEEVKRLFEEKNMETDQLNVNFDGEYLTVYNVHSYPSFFGTVLGINTYRTEVDVTAYMDADNKIIIKDNDGE